MACGLLAGGTVLLAALWFHRPEPPETPEQSLTRQLKKGLPVWLDKKGVPACHRWVIGQGGLDPKPDERCSLALEVLHYGCLELVPDPQTEKFRFETDVLHFSGAAGEVGIYLMNHQEGKDTHEIHYLATLNSATIVPRLPAGFFPCQVPPSRVSTSIAFSYCSGLVMGTAGMAFSSG